MTKLRTALTVGVVVVAGMGGAAGVALVHQTSPGAARSLAAVQLGVVVALAVAVWVLVGPLAKRIDELVEALRALARGDKHTRVDVASFGALAEIARATNEVGASLCENDDPNLGPVLKRTRDHVVEAPQPRRSAVETRPPPQATDNAARAPRGAVQEISEHPEIGPVRVRPRDAARNGVDDDAPRPIIDGESVSEARPARRSSSKARRGAPPPSSAAASPPSPATADAPADPVAASGDASAKTESAVAALAPGAPGPASSEAPSLGEAAAPAPTVASTSSPASDASSTAAAAVADSGAPPPSTTTDPSDGAVPATAPPDAPAPTVEASGTASSSSPATGHVVADVEPSSNDTVIEPARPAPVSIPPLTNAQLPGRDELHVLFNEFVQAKKAAGVDDGLDVDFDAFADTIRGESERLIVEHACRGVRFEVAVAEGEVSLRPRLVR